MENFLYTMHKLYFNTNTHSFLNKDNKDIFFTLIWQGYYWIVEGIYVMFFPRTTFDECDIIVVYT